MRETIKEILNIFGMPFLIKKNSLFDTAFQANITYDFEIFSKYLNRFVEVSSCSSTIDFQTYRAGIKFKDKFAFSANASCFPNERFIFCLLDLYTIEELEKKIDDLIFFYK